MTADTTFTLSGTTVSWIRENTSWGTHGDGGPAARNARFTLLAAPRRRVGKGSQYLVPMLTAKELESLHGILESIAEAGESMLPEERGEASGEYRAIRKDADRVKAVIAALPPAPAKLSQKEIADRKEIAADFVASYRRDVDDKIRALASAHAHLLSAEAALRIWTAKLEAGEAAPLEDLVPNFSKDPQS